MLDITEGLLRGSPPPLTKLTRKEVRFVWSEECEASFQELKERLTSAPVLALHQGQKGLWYIVMPQKGVWDVY